MWKRYRNEIIKHYCMYSDVKSSYHRLNIGVRPPKFIWAPVYSVHLNSLAETPQLPSSPAFGLILEGAIGQLR
jgi:hypothetical protein